MFYVLCKVTEDGYIDTILDTFSTEEYAVCRFNYLNMTTPDLLAIWEVKSLRGLSKNFWELIAHKPYIRNTKEGYIVI